MSFLITVGLLLLIFQDTRGDMFGAFDKLLQMILNLKLLLSAYTADSPLIFFAVLKHGCLFVGVFCREWRHEGRNVGR